MRRLVLAVGLVIMTATASAQEPDIVVVGDRLRDATVSFVGAISVEVSTDNQIARWQGDICPSVVGMRAREAQALIDRIALRAYQVDVDTGDSGCRPNVLIFYAADGNSIAQSLFNEDRSLFAYFYEQNISTRGHEALRDFLDAPRAVRWWHVVRRTEASGMHLASSNARVQPSSSGESPDGFRDVQTVRSHGSRLRQSIRQEFARVIVIIDGRLTQGIPVLALADYVAMATLAQLDPDGDTSAHSTILNLFDVPEDERPLEMTAWDLTYLRGLYRVTPEAASATQQEAEIVRSMVGELQEN